MPIVKCSQCGKAFHKFQSQITRSKNHFCSKECRLEHDKKDEIFIKCDYCGKKFETSSYRFKHNKNNYCCELCRTNGSQKANNIKIFDDHAQIIINSPKFGEHITYIDLEDVEKINKVRWCLYFDTTVNGFYVHAHGKNGTLRLHRLIMDCPKDMQVDHIDRQTLNNRRSNLRIVTNQINSINKMKAFKNNKNGQLNVSWSNTNNLWRVRFRIDGKEKYVGGYRNYDEAVKVANLKRKEFFGKYIKEFNDEELCQK